MSGSRNRRHFIAMATLVELALTSAWAAQPAQPRTGIFARIYAQMGRPGIVGPCGGQGNRDWIPVATLELAGQKIQAPALWYITPPAGAGEMTLTRQPDAASPRISAVYRPSPHPVDFPVVDVDLCSVDARGVLAKVQRYSLHDVTLTLFTSTPSGETLVLTYAKADSYFPPHGPGIPWLTPTPIIKRLPATSGSGRTLRMAATPTPPR